MRCLRLCGVIVLLAAACLALAPLSHASESAPEGQAEHHLGAQLPLWSTIPFAGILLSIALFPLAAPRFWHHHYPKITTAWALALAVPFLFSYGQLAWGEIAHIYALDYIPFIILLWGLFTISGGILISGTLRGTPALNSAIILIGTALASWIGTTGASMLLIRPLLRANAWRKNKSHIVIFFIFLVSNIGGSLTPLGDPPLFLGFLHSVPFFWTLNLLPHLMLVSVILLAVFYAWDTLAYRREMAASTRATPAETTERTPLRIEGLVNAPLLLGIMAAVLMSGIWHPGEIHLGPVHLGIQNLVRDVLIVAMGLLSLKLTPKDLHQRNEFTWEPIREVAILFAGIFMTIIPALAILKAGTDGSLSFLIRRVQEPSHYFWITGSLSAFLDNAPTYLTFFNTALGNFFGGLPEKEAVALLIEQQNIYLIAIAAGAVFFGASTYIGNAPNFMVKAIAEENGVPMPSFFGYLLRYSLPILGPVFVLVSWVFFSA
ncbi:MAG: sodium:proton antiporter [Acidobacteriota bacterium]